MYQNDYGKSNIITPVFGGLTPQTEYETLTGNSVEFLGSGNIAYINYVKKNQFSLVKLFSDRDYNSFAIHPYLRDFYRRDLVYEKLGFDKFISQEEFIRTDDISRYISDMDTYSKLIDEYEKSKKPIFAHIVTMQNHAPYDSYNKSSNSSIKNNIQPESLNQVEGYMRMLKETDIALEYLINYFEKKDEPTIIVFYGDHPPVLGDFYLDMGITTTESMNKNETLELYKTPLLIWNNFDLKYDSYEYLDASYLSATLLDMIGVNDLTYYQIIENIMSKIRAFNQNFIVDNNNTYIPKNEINDEQKLILDELWLLQYDRIFGKNYLDAYVN